MTIGVAAFDFDGTLTRRDTFLPFCRVVGGTGSWSAATLSCARHIAERDRGRRRDHAKATMIRRVFAGRAVDAVEPIARRYAHGLGRRLWPDPVRKVDWHRRQGHRLVLVSASLEMYAGPAAQALGFDDVIAVELEDLDGRFTGAIDGPNVRGDVKADRLASLLDGAESELWAYGNSAGDDAMLAMADHPHRVTRRGRIVATDAARREWPVRPAGLRSDTSP